MIVVILFFMNIHLPKLLTETFESVSGMVGPASMFVIGMLMAGADLKKNIYESESLSGNRPETDCCTGIFSFDSEDQRACWNSCRRAADSVDSISCSNNTGSIYGDTDEPDLWE